MFRKLWKKIIDPVLCMFFLLKAVTAEWVKLSYYIFLRKYFEKTDTLTIKVCKQPTQNVILKIIQCIFFKTRERFFFQILFLYLKQFRYFCRILTIYFTINWKIICLYLNTSFVCYPYVSLYKPNKNIL